MSSNDSNSNSYQYHTGQQSQGNPSQQGAPSTDMSPLSPDYHTPPAWAPVQGGQTYPVAQYSSIANYDGSYTGRRFPQIPPIPQQASQAGNIPSHPLAHGRLVVPSNAHGRVLPRSTSTAGPSSSSSSSSSGKAHVCEICGSSFTRAHDRKRHSQIHTRRPDEKPTCEFCSRKFSRDDALKRHLDHGCDEMPDDIYDKRRLAK